MSRPKRNYLAPDVVGTAVARAQADEREACAAIVGRECLRMGVADLGKALVRAIRAGK